MAGTETIVEFAPYDGEGASHVSYALEAVAALNFSTIVFEESSYTRALTWSSFEQLYVDDRTTRVVMRSRILQTSKCKHENGVVRREVPTWSKIF